MIRCCQDPNYLATIMQGKDSVVLLDIRVPTQPLAELKGHESPVNAISWAPHSQCHICTAGDDSHALIWDMSSCRNGPVGQVMEGEARTRRPTTIDCPPELFLPVMSCNARFLADS